jgi:hypothetical protein
MRRATQAARREPKRSASASQARRWPSVSFGIGQISSQ